MFLSCCRGDVSAIYDRAPHSFESSDKFPWPENEIKLLYKPTQKQLPPLDKAQEWNRKYFKPLDMPIDCYICFTTLPDSRYCRINNFCKKVPLIVYSILEFTT